MPAPKKYDAETQERAVDERSEASGVDECHQLRNRALPQMTEPGADFRAATEIVDYVVPDPAPNEVVSVDIWDRIRWECAEA